MFNSFRSPLPWVLGLSLSCLTAHGASVPGITPAVWATLAFDRNNTFGWRFIPAIDVNVTALGYFDSSSLPLGTGAGLTQPHQVGIYRVSDQVLLASNSIPSGTDAPLQGNYRYMPLDAPVHLNAGTTYLMAGFALSTSPDPAPAATNWTFTPWISYANSPTPTPATPTFGTALYVVSVHGNPPAVLTYPAIAETGVLPTFAANFQFTPVLPRLTGLTIVSNTVVLSAADLTVGVTCFVEKSPDLVSWQTVQNFVPDSSTNNLVTDGAGDPVAFYRLRVGQ